MLYSPLTDRAGLGGSAFSLRGNALPAPSAWAGLFGSLIGLNGFGYAHAKWFYEGKPPAPDWADLWQPVPLLALGTVLLLTFLAAVAWQKRGRRGFLPGPAWFGATPDRRAALYAMMPAVVGVHLAVALLVSGVQGRLFSVDNALPAGWANLLGLGQIGIGLAVAYGGMTRLAALGLAGTWLLGVALLGLEPMLENVFVLGLAAFFWLAGRGPVAVDRLVFPSLEPSARLMAWAVPALRVGLGLSLVVVAFTEKLANPGLAEAFLRQHALNFLPALGLPVSDAAFAVLAGSVELLVGLWLVAGVFPREVVLLAWVPFNLTLTVFDWVELVGHLPFYAGMALLLVWEPGRANLEVWLHGLRGGPLAVNLRKLGQHSRARRGP